MRNPQQNNAHKAINRLKKKGQKHKSFVDKVEARKTFHGLSFCDAKTFLKKIPDSSIQLIIIDPPYNIDLETWDHFDNYLEWAKTWLDEIYRILTDTGNCVIFGGFQFQDLKNGDLLEILHYSRHETQLRFINLIIWHYKNGMGAQRFFANRHEEAIWLAKSKKYYFDLDAVRTPYDEKALASALKDKRLNPENVLKGKNPTNVWQIKRLNSNSLERVGHPTQKPSELIRRFVRSLSFQGSLVLDFFAGSGTTGRVCIEEGRHSILADSDKNLEIYLQKHLEQINHTIQKIPYEIRILDNIPAFFHSVNHQL